MIGQRKLKKFFIIFSYFFIFLILICSDTIYSCGPYSDKAGDLDTLSFIEPSIVGDSFLNRFYYHFSEPYGLDVSFHSRYYHRKHVYNSMYNEMKYKANVKEWQDYFKKYLKIEVSEKQIKAVVYENKDFNSRFGKKDKDTQEYLEFVHKVNPVLSGVTEVYGWSKNKSYEDSQRIMRNLYKVAYQYAEDKQLNRLLRAKYAFQAIRLSVLLEEYERALKDYNKLMSQLKVHSFIRYQVLGYRARALLKTGKRYLALKTYVVIFDQSPAFAKMCLNSIGYFNNRDWEEYFIKEKSKHKKTTAYFMRALNEGRDYSVSYLSKMLELSPKASKPEALLVRMIQIIEKYHMPIELYNLLLKKNQKFKGLVNRLFQKKKYGKLVELCAKAGEMKKIRQPALWFAGGAYLCLLEGDTKKAEFLYKKALEKGTKRKALKKQIHLIGSLIQFQNEKSSFSDSLKERFIKDIKWAETLTKVDVNNHGLYHSIWVLMAQKFLLIKDIAHAVLCFAKADSVYGFAHDDLYWSSWHSHSVCGNYLLDVIADGKDLKEMEKIFKNKSKTLFLQVLTDKLIINKDDIIFLQGIKMMRKENYITALKQFNRITKKYWEQGKKTKIGWYGSHDYFYRNSRLFLRKIVTFTRFLPDSKIEEAWEKSDIRGFTEFMIYLHKQKRDAKTKSERSSIHFILGNVYNSLDLTGFRIIFGMGDRSINRKLSSWADRFFYNYDKKRFKQFPFNVPGLEKFLKKRSDIYFEEVDYFRKAKSHYQKVITSGYDKELSAKSCFLMNSKEYFLKLNRKYKDTKFYQSILAECPSLDKYK